MRSYCVKQKKVTECVPGSERYEKAKNGRLMLKCSSYIVGGTKAFFSKCSLTKPNYISTFHLMVIFYGNLYVFISYVGRSRAGSGSRHFSDE